MYHSQKVCPVQVRKKLDPFHRNKWGLAIGARGDLSPGMCAIIEFLIQVPIHQRGTKPVVENLCVTADRRLLMNGMPIGDLEDLERALRLWSLAMDLDREYERASFQAMIDANMGVQGASGVVL